MRLRLIKIRSGFISMLSVVGQRLSSIHTKHKSKDTWCVSALTNHRPRPASGIQLVFPLLH